MTNDCRRCTSTGRQCDGYTLPNTITFEVFDDRAEVRSYQFFRERTCSELSGYYDDSFWNSLILQVSVSHKPIRHALTAIGSLHESMDSVPAGNLYERSKTPYIFALQQFTKAIGELTNQGTSPLPTEIVLLSCVLFICWENAQGNFDGAMEHLQNGLKILHEWKTQHEKSGKRTPSSEVIDNHLVPLFARLDMQYNTHVEKRPGSPRVTSYKPMLAHNGDTVLPETFSNLHEARVCLEVLIAKITSLMIARGEMCLALKLRVDEPSLATNAKDIADLTDDVENWLVKLNAFVKEHQSRDDINFIRAYVFLKIYHLSTFILLRATNQPGETSFDAYDEGFKQVIAHCQHYQELTRHPKADGTKKTTFGFDLGVIPPLYIAASRCRDPSIRRDAIGILRSLRHREGIWDSMISEQIAEHIMAIEEAGLTNIRTSNDVPEWNRIRLLNAKPEFKPAMDGSG